MEELKKKRTILRRFFSNAEKDMLAAFDEKRSDISALYKYFEDKAEELLKIDDEIRDLLFQSNLEEDKIFKELEIAEEYRRRFYKVRAEYENYSRPPPRHIGSESVSGSTVKSIDGYKRFKLPILELKKFDGQAINWITFWGQFKRIHEDAKIDDFDKFRYLIQSTEPLSKARQFVESFPPSGENYLRVVSELKERFARDDLLIETYIRKLLHMVIYTKNDLSLTDLYDSLSCQLHALESLGVTTDKYAAMLLPMVESAIPIDVLKSWERTRDRSERPDLKKLLAYLKAEVESEERIFVAKEGFIVQASTSKQPTTSCIVAQPKKTPLSDETKATCIFCQKVHSSTECSKLSTLSLDEKKTILKEKRACYICMKIGHGAKICRNFPKCLICSRRHYVAMCPRLEEIRSTKEEDRSKNEAMLCLQTKTTFLQTTLVNILYKGKKVVARALFDSGSQRSYIRQNIATKLCMEVSQSEVMTHCLFGGYETKRGCINSYSFSIESLDTKFKLDIEACGQKKICGSILRLIDTTLKNKLKSLNIDIYDGDIENTEIGLLLGADIIGHVLTGHIVHIDGSLVAIDTKLGWTLQGQICKGISCNVVSCLLNFSVSELWEIELLGIKSPSDIKTKHKEESETLQHFRDTVSRDVDGRYVVNLPWKDGFPEMLCTENREMAYKRLVSTTNKLKITGNVDRYNKVFEDWLNEGIIERADDSSDNHGLYLYHHAVIKGTSATTPVRPVFDASAKCQGLSLNDGLEKGANLLENIPKLLISFRKRAIGITADIRKAFLQISIVEKDRHYLKFLWWDDVDNGTSVVTFRHKRVVFGVTCSPFLLAATINHHLDQVVNDRKEVAQQLRSSFYVDNCVHSVNTEFECQKFINTAKKLMQEGGFDLRGWVYGPSENETVQSVLGLMWNSREDVLFIEPQSIELNNVVTKRMLLSSALKIFDPIGYLSPTTIVPKMILQKCWLLKLDWDDRLPDDIVKEFLAWSKQLMVLKDIKIPRRITYFPIDSCNKSIHTFCDASKHAYAACVFLRTEYNGKVQVQLLLAKARVAPVKEMTIPNLELVAAVIAIRLYRETVEALDLKNVQSFFWSDSLVVITWIKRNNNGTVFVNNRIKEIKSVTDSSQWHHIAGRYNPADLPSRGCLPEILKASRWWAGPSWLYFDSCDWPKSDEGSEDKSISSDINTIIVTNKECFSEKLLYFSKYSKIVRCVGWILRFVYNCKYCNSRRRLNLSYEEYNNAELVLLKLIQSETYGVVTKSPVQSLETVIFDDGLIRVKSRLLLGDEPDSYKYPILLQGNHIIVHRLIFQNYCNSQHAGATIVISRLRELYWLTRARINVKKVISTCGICKRFMCKVAQAPAASLPENRIKTGKVFEVVGVDLAGPLLLKSGEKCWIVIFTCAVLGQFI